MENKVSSPKILNIVVCVILLIIFVIYNAVNVNAEEISPKEELINKIELGNKYPGLINNNPINIGKEINKLENFINEKKETILFFTNMFGYDYEEVVNIIINKEKEYGYFIENNIGYITNKDGTLNEYKNFEYGLIEYLYKIKDIKRTKKYVPYNGSSEYVEKLIIYFSNIYDNVDPVVLLSIGAAESGYYKVKYMLKSNNIYGGMSRSGLIKHENIELGVLSYTRMMSKNYYGKGLNNIYSIGKVYCPVIENNTKIASPHWINLVNKAIEKYKDIEKNITINDLI